MSLLYSNYPTAHKRMATESSVHGRDPGGYVSDGRWSRICEAGMISAVFCTGSEVGRAHGGIHRVEPEVPSAVLSPYAP